MDCTETDDSHGQLMTWYVTKDPAPASDYTAQAGQMVNYMKKAGLGTANITGSLVNHDISVNVNVGTYQIVVQYPDLHEDVTYGVDTCYSTPPPATFPPLGETTPVPRPAPTNSGH